MRSTKTSAAPDPAVKRLVDYFHDAHVKRHGFKPDPREFGRFAKALKSLLIAWDEETIRSLVDDFFFDRGIQGNRYIVRDWKPMDFANAAQRLMLRRNGSAGGHDQRTSENIDAARRATGSKS